jgi:hypothetical protein
VIELIILLVERRKIQNRQFFDDYAKSKNLNALDAEVWYSVTWKELIRAVSLIFILNELFIIIQGSNEGARNLLWITCQSTD